MNIVKGFVVINDYVKNEPGVIAPLGELSTWSMTYTKERGEYTTGLIAGYKLVTFTCVDSVTGNKVELEENQVFEILRVVREIGIYGAANMRPYDPTDFRNSITATFNSAMGNFNFGRFVDNDQLAMPEWISWTSLSFDNTTIKIWLSDESFKAQYDDFDITIIPPIPDMDDFFKNYSTVVAQLSLVDPVERMDELQAAKELHPETYIRTYRFDFVNRVNPSMKHPTYWNLLIYGQAGDNIDSVKDRIVEYILENSSNSQSDWEQIMPDLFKRTEFVLVPRWDKQAIGNMNNIAGLYSSMIDPKESVQFAKTVVSFYNSLHVEDNCTLFPHDYKTLMIIAVNGENNLSGREKLNQLYPDYLPVPSTSVDFARMEISTREWSLALSEALTVAEVATEYTAVPSGVRKVYRSGNLFISFIFDNMNYLVAARSNPFYTP